MSDDLGDARSRFENDRFREVTERRKASDPEYAYAPRWAPIGNWRLSAFDIVLIVFGAVIIATVVVMGLSGAFDIVPPTVAPGR
jgi:hypothetical protein